MRCALALDADDLAKIQELITGSISGLETKLPRVVGQLVELKTKGVASKEDIEGLLAEIKTKGKGAEGGGSGDKGDKGGEGGDKSKGAEGDAGEFAMLRRQMAALEKQARESAERAEAAEAARLRSMRDVTIRSALEAAGVNPHLRAALQSFLVAEERVKIADDGAIVFVQPTEIGTTEEVALDAGLKSFLGTEAGKAYLPARDKGGTGEGGRGGSEGGSGGGEGAVVRRPGDIVLGAMDRLRRQG